jgi:hypothetical protein
MNVKRGTGREEGEREGEGWVSMTEVLYMHI